VQPVEIVTSIAGLGITVTLPKISVGATEAATEVAALGVIARLPNATVGLTVATTIVVLATGVPA